MLVLQSIFPKEFRKTHRIGWEGSQSVQEMVGLAELEFGAQDHNLHIFGSILWNQSTGK